MISLKDCRKDIDAIDKQIVELLLKRNQISLTIADVKLATNDYIVYKPDREEEILTKLKKYARAEHEKNMIENVYKEIMKCSRLTQLQYMVNRLH